MNIDQILGTHPLTDLGNSLTSSDSKTDSGHPHRSLRENSSAPTSLTTILRTHLCKHHVDPQTQAAKIAAMKRLGFGEELKKLKRFPTSSTTQKGNLAEVFLAEYITEATKSVIPVYRLRYNPNVDQSMKGDDVLAFDVDSDPMRIIVGEAKFRSTSSKQAVKEMVTGLVRSHASGVPTSLHFVADSLFREGNEELGTKVLQCSIDITKGKLQLDYVGLLMGDSSSDSHVRRHTNGNLQRLAVISFKSEDPNKLVHLCFDKLEEDL